jgi:hypothetical protein
MSPRNRAISVHIDKWREKSVGTGLLEKVAETMQTHSFARGIYKKLICIDCEAPMPITEHTEMSIRPRRWLNIAFKVGVIAKEAVAIALFQKVLNGSVIRPV